MWWEVVKFVNSRKLMSIFDCWIKGGLMMTCWRLSFSRTKSCRLNTVMVDLFCCIKRHSIYILTMEFFSVPVLSPFFGGNLGKIVKLIIINIKSSEFSTDWGFYFFFAFYWIGFWTDVIVYIKKKILLLHIKNWVIYNSCHFTLIVCHIRKYRLKLQIN